MQTVLRTSAVLLLLPATLFSGFIKKDSPKPLVEKHTIVVNAPLTNAVKVDDATYLRLRQKGDEAMSYASANGFNTNRCFLVDMRIHSGLNRFFIYNLQNGNVEDAGLVSHGTGSDNRSGDLVFSNEPNSNCTSLGKYKIGKPYQGTYGLSYKLYGMENTNSNAFARAVVLHSHGAVPNSEVAPSHIFESWGCPTVSPSFLYELSTILDHSAKPVLLWIYY